MNEPQKSAEWEPTPKQAALLEVAQNPGLKRTVSAVCEEAGVDRSSFYSWIKDPNFKAAWEESWHLAIKRQMSGVVAAQVNQALDGDTAAARFLADLAGMMKVKSEQSGAMTIRVEYVDVKMPEGMKGA